MNERIQELAIHAREYAQRYVHESVIDYGKTASEFKRIFESKFAELIVKECAMFARQFNLEKLERSHMIHLAMKEKFGVEE